MGDIGVLSADASQTYPCFEGGVSPAPGCGFSSLCELSRLQLICFRVDGLLREPFNRSFRAMVSDVGGIPIRCYAHT